LTIIVNMPEWELKIDVNKNVNKPNNRTFNIQIIVISLKI